MLLVNTLVKPSDIHGLGCFACQSIKKGEVVWVYDQQLDLKFRDDELLNFPEPIQKFLKMYCYLDFRSSEEYWILCGDNARHMNHADHPNLIYNPETLSDIAGQDIQPGEELTCDYYSFDKAASQKLPN